MVMYMGQGREPEYFHTWGLPSLPKGREIYYLTQAGISYMERLERDLENPQMPISKYRELWVLTQYARGRDSATGGNILGRVFKSLVSQSYIALGDEATVQRRLSGYSS